MIEHMDRIAKLHPEFLAECPAWTVVYLSVGKGKGLEGRLVNVNQDIEEVKTFVLATPRPRITNSCG